MVGGTATFGTRPAFAFVERTLHFPGFLTQMGAPQQTAVATTTHAIPHLTPSDCWGGEELEEPFLREAKPGGFQTGGFPLFSGKVQILSRTLSGLFLVGALTRPRKRKRTNRENPRTFPEQIGKIPEKTGKAPKRTKMDKKRKDKSRSGNHPVKNPPV